jgi:hypothetical protein
VERRPIETYGLSHGSDALVQIELARLGIGTQLTAKFPGKQSRDGKLNDDRSIV